MTFNICSANPGRRRQGRRDRPAECEFNLGCRLDRGVGGAAPDYPAAAGWCRRAADAGVGDAAVNLHTMYTVGRGRAWQIMPMPARHHPHFSPSFLQGASHINTCYDILHI